MTRILRNLFIISVLLLVGSLTAMAQGVILPPPGVGYQSSIVII